MAILMSRISTSSNGHTIIAKTNATRIILSRANTAPKPHTDSLTHSLSFYVIKINTILCDVTQHIKRPHDAFKE